MVVDDRAPVWSNLGQTSFHPRRVPGARYSYCPADAFEESCQDPNNPYGGSSMDLFGLGNVLFPNVPRADYAVNPLSSIGNVMFPNVPRADYAVNPLSGPMQERMAYENSSEMFGIGTVRVPETEGFDGMGTIRVPDAQGFDGLGAIDLKGPEMWTLLAAVALVGGSFYTKGNVKDILRGLGIVVGGIGAASVVNKISQ